jgi:hypothetical protein
MRPIGGKIIFECLIILGLFNDLEIFGFVTK